MGNAIAKIYKSNDHHFLKDLKGAKTLDEEKLHKVRVDIKNIRVLIELLKVLGARKFRRKALLELLNPVFRSAGRIRTATLNLHNSRHYQSKILQRFRQNLELKREEGHREFLKTLRKFDTGKFRKLHRKALEEFKDIKKKDLKSGSENYLRALLTHIRTDVFDISDDETLHQIRKRLKSVKSVGALLGKIDKDNAFAEELEKVEVIYDMIGKWHDNVELVDALEQYVDELDEPQALEDSAPLLLRLKKQGLRNKLEIEKRLKIDLVM